MSLGAGQVALGVVAAFSAGFVDAVVGGGGLIQLPAITLILPESTPTSVVLGTNKFAAITGTSIAAVTYRSRLGATLRMLAPPILVAMAMSYSGAYCSRFISKDAFRPVVIVALLVVLGLTIRKPNLGVGERLAIPGHVRRRRILAIAAAIGFYDGLIGPGTGTFFTIALVLAANVDFLQASATAKVLNVGTNLGALVRFVPVGAVFWSLAIPMALANITGGFLGARLAIRKGARFVRAFFLVVVCTLIVKLGWDVARNF